MISGSGVPVRNIRNQISACKPNFIPMGTPDTTARPLRADARRNRQLVLDAARACFARDGVKAQIDDIASCAGVGVGTVYRHFPTKEALIEALARDYFVQLSGQARAALEVADPWHAFSGYMRGAAELLAENRALAQMASDKPGLMKQAAESEPGFFDTLNAMIGRAKEADSLRDDFQLQDVPAIMCALGSLQISRGEWRRLLELVLDGSRAV
jgi:AcrR family transcriptional regulator